MIQPLQPFDDNRYHRPNDKWAESGVYAAADENVDASIALRKHGTRWRRKVFTLSAFAFVVGSLMILMNSPYRNEFLAPGPLCSSHAQILAGQGADRCAACHGAADKGILSWATDAFTGGNTIKVDQSELCMKCHNESLVSEYAKLPHNVAAEKLAALSDKFDQTSFRMGGPVSSAGEIACAACHREHHGDQSLTQLTDQQCQSCHSQNYHSFENDHPEFVNWPNDRRQGIAFDHTTHGLKYFPEKSQSFTCNVCHIDDNNHNVKLLAPYEQTCAQCHDNQIHDGGKEGMQLVGLPMLDLDSIERSGLTVGQWPAGASGDFDGAIPPITQLLLGADPKIKSLLAGLGEDFSFMDVDPDDDSQLKNVVEIVWALKGLIFDLAENGPEEIRSRVEVVIERELTDREFASLMKNLDESVFETCAQRWLPKLALEVPLHRDGKLVPQTAFQMDYDRILTFLRPQDPGELAPNPLAGLISAQPQTAGELSANPIAQGNATPQQNATSWEKKTVIGSPDSDPDYLAVNPLQSLGTGVAAAAPKAPSIIKNNNPQTPQQPIADAFPQATGADANTLSGVHSVSTRQSGWFRNDEMLQISYKPAGHADEYVKTWTDIITSAAAADARTETKPLFDKLTKWSGGFGGCAKCHTVDAKDDTSFVANWLPAYRDPTTRDFTHFSHGPHLIQPHLKDCTACHAMDQSKRNVESFQNFDPSLVISNFAPIKKANCASCHAEGKTESGCTQCHNYHVGSQVIRKD